MRGGWKQGRHCRSYRTGWSVGGFFRVAGSCPRKTSSETSKATDGTELDLNNYWFPGFGFDSGPNLQPCSWSVGGVPSWGEWDRDRNDR